MKLYITEMPGEFLPFAAHKGLLNFMLGAASPSLYQYYSCNGLPDGARYNKILKSYVTNETVYPPQPERR